MSILQQQSKNPKIEQKYTPFLLSEAKGGQMTKTGTKCKRDVKHEGDTCHLHPRVAPSAPSAPLLVANAYSVHLPVSTGVQLPRTVTDQIQVELMLLATNDNINNNIKTMSKIIKLFRELHIDMQWPRRKPGDQVSCIHNVIHRVWDYAGPYDIQIFLNKSRIALLAYAKNNSLTKLENQLVYDMENDYQFQITTKKQELYDLTQQHNRLVETLKEVTAAQKDRAKEHHNNIKEHHNNMAVLKTKYKTQINELSQQIAELKTHKKEIEELKTHKKEIEELNIKHKSLVEKLKDVTASSITLKEKEKVLTETHKKEIDLHIKKEKELTETHKKELEIHQNEIEELNIKHKRVLEKLKEKEKELNVCHSWVNEIEELNIKHKRVLEKLKEKEKELTETHKKEIEAFQKKISDCKKEFDGLIETHQKKLKNCAKELEILKLEWKQEQEEEIEEKKEEIATLSTVVTAVTALMKKDFTQTFNQLKLKERWDNLTHKKKGSFLDIGTFIEELSNTDKKIKDVYWDDWFIKKNWKENRTEEDKEDKGAITFSKQGELITASADPRLIAYLQSMEKSVERLKHKKRYAFTVDRIVRCLFYTLKKEGKKNKKKKKKKKKKK